MNKFFTLMGLVCGLALPVAAATSVNKTVVLAVIDDEPKASFEANTLGLLKSEIKNCAACEIRNFSPYDKEGNFLESELVQGLEQAQKSASFLFLSWNRPMAADHRSIVDALKKMMVDKFVVIATTGAAGADQSTLPLNRTVVGQVPGVIIVGELVERDNLLAKSFFGPEMLTAIRPPKEYLGQGHGPLFFAGRLALNWDKKQSSDWPDHFRSTRQRSRKIWPGIEDFF